MFSHFRTQRSGLLGKLLTAGLLVVVLTFSMLVFAVLITGAAIVWGYLWWKTRNVRKQMRGQPVGGQIIEGEVIREFSDRPAPESRLNGRLPDSQV